MPSSAPQASLPSPISTGSDSRSTGREGDWAWTHAQRPGWAELGQSLLAWPAICWQRRDLIRTSVRRDLEARVRGTALGWLWMLVQPLLLFAVYAFLFTTLLGVRIGGDEIPAAAMGVYMFTGTLVWAAFGDALGRSTSCVVDQRNLVRSVRFPAQLLPLQVALSAQVTFLIGVVAFVAFTALTSIWPAPSLQQLAWIPLLLLLQTLLTTGFGLALASVHVLWRDTLPFLTVALTVWMFATPIFWVASPELLPGVEPYLGWIEANPAYHLVQAWRVVLMGSDPSVAFPQEFAVSLVHLTLWSLGAFCAGSLVFLRLQRQLADEV
jgi:homopolymeric O-antigen transport system permease protein